MRSVLDDWRLVIFACLTLGLAPYSPPHIVGKIQWIAGGAVGMQPIDWFDVVLHGTPWLLLIRLVVVTILRNNGKPTPNQ